MVAVEYIGTMVKGRLEWYRRLQETAWAMITEAFSERVIEPGVSSTEVCFFDLVISGGSAILRKRNGCNSGVMEC